MTNDYVHRLNLQRQKWVTTQPPVRALYPFVSLIVDLTHGYLMDHYPPRVNFESMEYFLPHFLRWVILVTSVCGCGTRRLNQGRRVLIQERWRLIQHYNRLHDSKTGPKSREADRTFPHCLVLLWCLRSRTRRCGRSRLLFGERRFCIVPDAARDTRCSISDGREIHAHKPQYHVVRCM